MKTPPEKQITVLSLGAGVQSSTMALMAARGEIKPLPTCAIFADVGAEPDEVYEYLDWLKGELPFPVYTVKTKEGLTKMMESTVQNGGRSTQPPLFTEGGGILRRMCTVEYKILPIKQKIRGLLGLKKGERAKGHFCENWIGISLDEIQRMKESLDKYIQHRFPLVENRVSRGDCIEWMKKNGYPKPPRSACVYCPYHSNSEWRRIKKTDKKAWNEAVRVDKLIRNGWEGTRERMFLHNSLKPLDEVDFSNDVDRGQLTFMDECDGMCGV